MTIPYDTVLKKGQIRLLKLIALEDDGSDQSSVICTQKIVDLTSEPEYYALSYTWDLPYKNVVWENEHIKEISGVWGKEDAPPYYKFVVDGKELRMTPNLFFSLSDFADVALASWIWIDAICIRQNDEAEKAMQVQAMKDIYASAVAVLIGLGTEDYSFPHGSMGDVLEVVDCFVPNLRKAIAADHSILHTLELTSLTDPSFEAKIGIGDLAKKMMAFAEFCTIFRWFNRLWCIQEVVLARAVAVRCGERNVSWNAMEDLLHVLKNQRWDVWLGKCIEENTGYSGPLAWCGGLSSMCVLRSIVHGLDTTSAAYRRILSRGVSEFGNLLGDESDTAWIQGSSPVSHPLKKPTQTDPFLFSLCARLLTAAQFAECSNDFDRIYGFLGVFDAALAEDVSTLIDVNYTGSVSKLYLKVMVLLMQRSESLDLVTSQFPEYRDRQQRSSWMIDFRKPFPQSGVLAVEGDCASRGTRGIYESRFGKVNAFEVYHQDLCAFGGDLDRVSHILKLHASDGGILDVLEKIATVLASKSSGRPALEPVWRTLIQNRWTLLEGRQEPGPGVENFFLLYVLLEAVCEIAIRDRENKVDELIVEAQVQRFAKILSQFELGVTSDNTDGASYIDLLRFYLRYTCGMNDLNRESICLHRQAIAELFQLVNDGVMTPMDRDIALEKMQVRSIDGLPPQLVQVTAPYQRSMI